MTNRPCAHLEALLPKTKDPKRTVQFNDNIHRGPLRLKYVSPEEREASFRKWVAKFALPPEAVEFLISRYIDEKPLEVVAREQHFTNKMAAHRFEMWINRTLKERGLKPGRGK